MVGCLHKGNVNHARKNRLRLSAVQYKLHVGAMLGGQQPMVLYAYLVLLDLINLY